MGRLFLFIFCASLSLPSYSQPAIPAEAAIVRVDATPSHIINSFDPDSALGSSMDVLSRIDIGKVYSPHIVQESLSAG